ncbi:MAG TPA: AAA-like domain-containing protein [Chthonomonadaceae bacterium]|nr:AAA-like domain-containing protein [Chthonomonadaceae bacterium]
MGESGHHQSSLRFCLFGTFDVRQNGKPLEGLHLRKADRLLAYLVLHASRWVDREELASHFWSRNIFDDPEQNLRQSLVHIRQMLGEDVGCLESQGGRLRLVLQEAQADTLQVEAAYERGDASSLALAQRYAEEPLLEGWKDVWIGPIRERYTRKLKNALQRLQDQNEIGLQTAGQTAALPQTAALDMDVTGVKNVCPVGGIVPLNAPLYIARTSDATLYTALEQQEGILLIKGARQTGKSSLLARGLEYARARSWAVYHTDLEQLAPEDLTARKTFYLRLIALLAEQSEQEFTPEKDWKELLGATGNLERFLRRGLLATTDAPILWALDGVDKLFKTDYYNEFFALLRGIHTKRATEPHVPWGRFTLLIAAATEAHLYIRDLNQSPFNVGTRIALADFDDVQGAELQQRFASPLLSKIDPKRLGDLLGGHPYLLMRGLNEIKTRQLDFDAFERFALQADGPYHDHLEGMRRFLIADSELHADMLAILEGKPCSDASFFRLRSAGILSGDSSETAQPRCRLYAHYFERRLK